MKAKQYREMASDDLHGKIEEMQRHLFDLRSQGVTEKLENGHAIGNARREIARMKTVLRQRQK